MGRDSRPRGTAYSFGQVPESARRRVHRRPSRCSFHLLIAELDHTTRLSQSDGRGEASAFLVAGATIAQNRAGQNASFLQTDDRAISCCELMMREGRSQSPSVDPSPLMIGRCGQDTGRWTRRARHLQTLVEARAASSREIQSRSVIGRGSRGRLYSKSSDPPTP